MSRRGRGALANQPARKRRRIRARLYKAAGYRCAECGTTEHLTLDHVIPLARGGLDRQSNLQVLCQPCNNVKADSLPRSTAA